MTTSILEKNNKIINKKNISFNKDKFIKEMFLTDEQIKNKLDKIDEYYKTHKFIGIPVEEAYINGIKKLNFKYEL